MGGTISEVLARAPQFRNPIQQGLFRDLFQTAYADVARETLVRLPSCSRVTAG